jgi:hypothetical protein
VNGCEQARNKPAHCKTSAGPVPKNETAAQAGPLNGGVTGKASSNSEAEIYSSEGFAARFPIIATHFDIEAVLIDVRREIAIAKLTELDFQSHRLGELVRDGVLDVTVAADTLYEAALANGLIDAHGTDYIQAVLASGLGAR